METKPKGSVAEEERLHGSERCARFQDAFALSRGMWGTRSQRNETLGSQIDWRVHTES
jgi:hypothetical protein